MKKTFTPPLVLKLFGELRNLQPLFVAAAVATLTSCGSSKVVSLETNTAEESGLNLVKITNESKNTVLAGSSYGSRGVNPKSIIGWCKEAKIAWNPLRLLSVSPDGTQLAYVTRADGQDNVMVRGANSQGMATQRTFRDVSDFGWGADGVIYFSDRNMVNYYSSNNFIASVNAKQGNMVQQLTNGSVNDYNPVVTEDGKKVFFTRASKLGPSIWSLDRTNGTLTSCAPGFNPCLIPGDPESFYCVRTSSAGRSEIWHVNFVKGMETLVLTDKDHSFTNPALSPDGKWLAVQGNAMSKKSKKQNLDIFVVRTDGTQLTQLTYSPASDVCPVWSKDGRSIYFISSRANKDESYNIWRMNFSL